uniref:uncharacterized protein LOC122597664 n=1 Tax=Erigeron canadensis TaxID=72917 RepID=UPI001CB8A0C3|nr:uncharacterized protein LOC122597664 [Erigeron canadensis]
MKKLYQHTKGKVHPSPPPPPPSNTSDHYLSFLPLAIATLAAALSPEDQQVLAYLLSTGSKPSKNSGGGATTGGDHPPQFTCNCFTCYTSFWARWDSSPNRKKIHDIIDAYEDGLVHNTKKNGKNKKDRKSKGFSSSTNSAKPASSVTHAPPVVESVTHAPPQVEQKDGVSDDDIGSSSVRKIVSFIGERIWGVWGI